MATTGIVLNGDGTATLSISAADSALLPPGTLHLTLLLWYGSTSDTVLGTVEVLDPSMSAQTVAATWTGSTVTVRASQTQFVQGNAFSCVLTQSLTASGAAVNPVFEDWRLYYEPVGSTSAIAFNNTVQIAGTVTWKWFGVVDTPIPFANSTVQLYFGPVPYTALLATTTTDADGFYAFRTNLPTGNCFVTSPAGQVPAAYPLAPATADKSTAGTGPVATLDIAQSVGGV